MDSTLPTDFCWQYEQEFSEGWHSLAETDRGVIVKRVEEAVAAHGFSPRPRRYEQKVGNQLLIAHFLADGSVTDTNCVVIRGLTLHKVSWQLSDDFEHDLGRLPQLDQDVIIRRIEELSLYGSAIKMGVEQLEGLRLGHAMVEARWIPIRMGPCSIQLLGLSLRKFALAPLEGSEPRTRTGRLVEHAILVALVALLGVAVKAALAAFGLPLPF